jgi:hypothetical protein
MLSFVVVIMAALALPLPADAAEPVGRDYVVIRLYNAFGVADDTMRAAEHTAEAILREAGIPSVWRNCGGVGHRFHAANGCEAPLGAQEVVVRMIATPTKMSSDDTLGYSHVDTATHSGVLSTVLVDRVRSLASSTESDSATLLGRAIAHEIGHLLLGTVNHSGDGLMRAHWLADEVRLNTWRDWSFSNDQASTMRAQLSARWRMETPAAALTAFVKRALE